MTDAKAEPVREWTRAEVEAALRDILADSLGIDGSEVAPSAALVRDLGAESIDFLDIGFKIQHTFGVNLQTAEIRTRIMAWSSRVLPALSETLQTRYGVAVTAEELRGLESGGLSKVLAHVQAAKGLDAGPGAAEHLGRELVQRLVQDFSAQGFTVSGADQADMLGIMLTNLSPRRLTERTLDLLTVGALADFICGKLGARLRG
jgi:acyl carrier protein